MGVLQLVAELGTTSSGCTPSGSTELPRWFSRLQPPRRTTGSTTEWTRCILDKNYGGILIIWDRLFSPTTLWPDQAGRHVQHLELQTRGTWRSCVTGGRQHVCGIGGLRLGPPGWEPRTIDKSMPPPPEVTSRRRDPAFAKVLPSGLVRPAVTGGGRCAWPPTDGSSRWSAWYHAHSQRRSPIGGRVSPATASADPGQCSPAWKSVRTTTSAPWATSTQL